MEDTYAPRLARLLNYWTLIPAGAVDHFPRRSIFPAGEAVWKAKEYIAAWNFRTGELEHSIQFRTLILMTDRAFPQ